MDEAKIIATPKITYDDFKKVEIKIGKILTVERVEKSEKLLKLSVDFKEEAGPRQILSGIAKYFLNIEDLVGRKCPFVTNLEPKPLMGLESNGMILAVGGGPASTQGGEDPFSLFEVIPDELIGKRIK
jgi:methionyl-tRNA synthetase